MRKKEESGIAHIVLALPLLVVVIALLAALFVWRSGETGIKEAPSGHLVPSNTSMEEWGKEPSVKGLNPEQKKLGETPGFVFSPSDEKVKSNIVLYVDFNDARSTSFLAMNSASLQNLAVSHSASVEIRPVLGGETYGVYASEALAEAFALKSENAWDFLYKIAQEAPASVEKKKDDQIASIASLAEESEIREIDKNSIANGTFVSWLTSNTDDPHLKSGWDLPIILVGDERVETEDVDIFDTTHVHQIISEKLS